MAKRVQEKKSRTKLFSELKYRTADNNDGEIEILIQVKRSINRIEHSLVSHQSLFFGGWHDLYAIICDTKKKYAVPRLI